MGQQGRRHRALEYEATGKTINARYANGVKLVLDCWCQRQALVGSVAGAQYALWATGLGEAGDSGGIEVHPPRSNELKGAGGKRVVRLDVSNHARNFFDCIKSQASQRPLAGHAAISHRHAAASWILQRKLKYDPVKEQFIGDDEANGLRTRAARSPWAV